jgi:MFS family permease
LIAVPPIELPILTFQMPAMSRPAYRREMLTAIFFSFVLAAVDGGVIGVFARHTYKEHVSPATLALVVSLVIAASELANIISFVWPSWSAGRNKVTFINGLQAMILLLVACIALAPTSAIGLWMVLALVLLARVCWSGIVTIRTTIWRANYDREARSVAVGRFETTRQLIVAVGGFAIGSLLDIDAEQFRYVTPVAALIGVVGLNMFSRLRVRGHKALLARESAGHERAMSPLAGVVVVWRVLRQDHWFAKFMGAMFMLGLGNLMLTPLLVMIADETFGMKYRASIAVVTTIPYFVMPFAVPLWASLLARMHVVRFRAIHSWAFVVSNGVCVLACLFESRELLFLGAGLQGAALGGGALAWNLGHVDFAPVSQTSQYMATHVTLNGVRGLIAPFAASAMYHWLHRMGVNAGVWSLTITTLACVAGGLGFVMLRRAMGTLATAKARAG